MNLSNADLLYVGVMSLGAIAVAVATYARYKKRKKEREASKKNEEAYLKEQDQRMSEQTKAGEKIYEEAVAAEAAKSPTREVGNYGPSSRRAMVSPPKQVQTSNWAQKRMAEDTAARRRREDEDEQEMQRRRRDSDVYSQPDWQAPVNHTPARCSDNDTSSSRHHSSCSPSSGGWGDSDGGSSSSCSGDSGGGSCD